MGSQETVQSLYAALQAGDVEAILEHFHPDAIHRVYAATRMGSTFAGEFAGLPALRARFTEVHEAWRIHSIRRFDVVLESDRAGLRVEVDATERNGQRELRAKSTHFVTLRDDRVYEFEIFLNELELTRYASLQTELSNAS